MFLKLVIVYHVYVAEICSFTERTNPISGMLISSWIGIVKLILDGPLCSDSGHSTRHNLALVERLGCFVQQHIEASLVRHRLELGSLISIARGHLGTNLIERYGLVAVACARQLGSERVQVEIFEPLGVLENLLDGRVGTVRRVRVLLVKVERIDGHLARPLVRFRVNARRVEYLGVIGVVLVRLRVVFVLVFVDLFGDAIDVEFNETGAVDKHTTTERALGHERQSVVNHRIRGGVLVLGQF